MALVRKIVEVESTHRYLVPLVYDDEKYDPLALAADVVMAVDSPRIIDDGDDNVHGIGAYDPDQYEGEEIADTDYFTVEEVLTFSGHDERDYRNDGGEENDSDNLITD